jgi:hypothetical protein
MKYCGKSEDKTTIGSAALKAKDSKFSPPENFFKEVERSRRG